MSLKLLRLLPILSTTISLMFALDEDIFLRTWMDPSFRDRANAHLPAWFTNWGRRGRWVILISYPITWSTTLLNLASNRAQLQETGAEKWYWFGLMFSAAHMLFARKALRLLGMIKGDVPEGNCTVSMGEWLGMNWRRAVVTDAPAWGCVIVGFLRVVDLK